MAEIQNSENVDAISKKNYYGNFAQFQKS